jgi:SAM-dependent methyltransferase
MSGSVSVIPTWHRDMAREDAMGPAHAPYWRHFIGKVPEPDLSGKQVLDFGCNQGGFLRTLHAMRPFRRGLGVDIAAASVEAANRLKGDLPVHYEVASDLSRWPGQFDLAFSHEVIYLLPNLDFHARQIAGALRPGGAYYAVTGCHTDSALWPRWRTLIAGKTNVAPRDYSRDDYARAFAGAGLSVSVQKFAYDGLLPYQPDSDYYPTLSDQIYYYAEAKTIFRVMKGA